MTNKEAAASQWRCKQMLDLLSDVLLAGEISNEDLRTLEKNLANAVRFSNTSSYLTGTYRGQLAKKLVSDEIKRSAKESIADAKKDAREGVTRYGI